MPELGCRAKGKKSMIRCIVLPLRNVFHVLCTLFQWTDLSVMYTLFHIRTQYYTPPDTFSPKSSTATILRYEIYFYLSTDNGNE
jgi:hypothetical protein